MVNKIQWDAEYDVMHQKFSEYIDVYGLNDHMAHGWYNGLNMAMKFDDNGKMVSWDISNLQKNSSMIYSNWSFPNMIVWQKYLNWIWMWIIN